MIGACPWVIPASWHLPIIEVRDKFRSKRLLTRAEVAGRDLEIRQVYHGIVDALLDPAPPVLQNTDGDPLELTTLTYELGVTVAEVVERLTPLATLHGETHLADETHDASGVLVAASLNWIKAGNRNHKEWDNTTLGTLRIDGSRLVVEVNSARRRQRIEKEIAKRLGSDATLVDTTVSDIGEVLEQRRERGSMGVGEWPPDELPRTPELDAMEADLAQKHWDAWIDERIPALGNRTPRQAAKTVRGRERLEALLVDYAQQDFGVRNVFEPDIGELKRRLGLE